MVGAEGFEPPTLWSQTRCATRLRYAPTPISLSHQVQGVLRRSKEAVTSGAEERMEESVEDPCEQKQWQKYKAS
jgi:hypothetical protein